ncbi:MAG: permease-like cell division protein FtsX [Pseudomonadota bacterium]
MMYAKLMLKKLVQNLRTERKSLSVNLCILSIAFLSVTAVATLLTNLSHVITGAKEHFQLTVYLKTGADRQKTDALMGAIRTYPEVRDVKYLPSEEFREKFLSGQLAGDSEVAALGAEAFPSTLQVKLYPEFMEKTYAAQVVGKLEKVGIVEEVGYHENWMKNFSGFLKFVWIGFLVFGMLILISSLFVQSNMILLSFSKRKKAIEVMRLNGATNSYIGFPVLMEGFMLGLAGGAMSIGMTWVGVLLLKNEIAVYLQSFSAATIYFIPLPVIVALIALCAMTGVSGAYLASRKVLRV